jgi:predicted acyltransferase
MTDTDISSGLPSREVAVGTTAIAKSVSTRIIAVDVGRGLAMATLITIPFFRTALRAAPDWPVFRASREQLSHSAWHGVNFYDFGMPAFVLVMGMSIALALRRTVERGQIKPRFYFVLLRRAAILFFLGFLLNGGFQNHWPEIRISGPLQRIAICYFVGSVVILNLRLSGQIVLLVGLLLGYWALLTLVPVPGYGAGDLSFEGNLAAYVDKQWLPGLPQYGHGQWDSEGILTTLGALATCVMGIVLGHIFITDRLTPQERVWLLFLVGVGLISVGYLWSEWLPLNKKLWTPSLVPFFAGQSATHLAVIYQITDIWKKNWFFPLVVVGQNSLIAYLAVAFLPFKDIANRLAGGDIQRLLGAAGPLVLGLIQVGLCWVLLYWLYRRGLTMKL